MTDKAWYVLLCVLFVFLIAFLLGAECEHRAAPRAEEVSRMAQWCEVSGERYACLAHSARAHHDTGTSVWCHCVSTRGARTEYGLGD
jgi:hypothetical protein